MAPLAHHPSRRLKKVKSKIKATKKSVRRVRRAL